MPGFDKTGPLGLGSRSGKQKGRCSNKNFSFTEVTIADAAGKNRHRSNVMQSKGKCHSNSAEETMHHHEHKHEHKCRH